MKHYTYRHIKPLAARLARLALLMAALLPASSCDSYLDITPEGQVGRSDLLDTQSGIEDAMYGCYAQMRHNNLYGQYMTFGALDVMAQYLSCYGNNTLESLQAYDYSNTNVQAIFESVWTYMYNNISNVNSVLGSDRVSDATQFPYCIYRGEALGLRAFMHFDLVRLFAPQYTRNAKGEGIPYATRFSLDTPGFETVEDNYRHILDDLLLAEQLLADEGNCKDKGTFMADRRIHFNLQAVQATLARVYLTMGDNGKALEYAMKVIGDASLSLCQPSGFTSQMHGVLYPTETIFGIYYATWYDDIVGSKLQRQTTFSSLDPSANILAYYQDTDRRGGDTRNGFFGYNDGSNTLRLMKHSDEYARTGSTRPSSSALIPGINMIKLPEMYYIAAECLLQSDPSQATALMHKVYDSRGVTYEAGETVTIEQINAERYREMIGEGQEFFNRKRQHIAFPAVKQNEGEADRTIQPSDEIFTVPVPEIEYDYRN